LLTGVTVPLTLPAGAPLPGLGAISGPATPGFKSSGVKPVERSFGAGIFGEGN